MPTVVLSTLYTVTMHDDRLNLSLRRKTLPHSATLHTATLAEVAPTNMEHTGIQNSATAVLVP